MDKKKDPDYIAKLEKAIEKKYGSEAIQNPRKYWDEEKEKEYLQQLKIMAENQRVIDEKNQKVEVDGFFISKKLLTRKSEKRICPVCSAYSFEIKDDIYMRKFDCCYECYIEMAVTERENRRKVRLETKQ